jgi:hypothetical protein
VKEPVVVLTAIVVMSPAVIAVLTNAVVASWVVLVPAAAVGATGVPVKVGEAVFALALSCVWTAEVTPARNPSSAAVTVDTETLPEASEARAREAVRFDAVIVDAAPTMAA